MTQSFNIAGYKTLHLTGYYADDTGIISTSTLSEVAWACANAVVTPLSHSTVADPAL